MILLIWVIFGIFAFLSLFLSTYYVVREFFEMPIALDHHVRVVWDSMKGDRVKVIIACLILGPIAFIKVNLLARQIAEDFYE